jgi:hypothetical protein
MKHGVSRAKLRKGAEHFVRHSSAFILRICGRALSQRFGGLQMAIPWLPVSNSGGLKQTLLEIATAEH